MTFIPDPNERSWVSQQLSPISPSGQGVLQHLSPITPTGDTGVIFSMPRAVLQPLQQSAYGNDLPSGGGQNYTLSALSLPPMGQQQQQESSALAQLNSAASTLALESFSAADIDELLQNYQPSSESPSSSGPVKRQNLNFSATGVDKLQQSTSSVGPMRRGKKKKKQWRRAPFDLDALTSLDHLRQVKYQVEMDALERYTENSHSPGLFCLSCRSEDVTPEHVRGCAFGGVRPRMDDLVRGAVRIFVQLGQELGWEPTEVLNLYKRYVDMVMVTRDRREYVNRLI